MQFACCKEREVRNNYLRGTKIISKSAVLKNDKIKLIVARWAQREYDDKYKTTKFCDFHLLIHRRGMDAIRIVLHINRLTSS